MSPNKLSFALTIAIIAIVMFCCLIKTNGSKKIGMSSDTSITRSADTLNISGDTVNVTLVRKNLRWYLIEDTFEMEVSDVIITKNDSADITSVKYLYDGTFYEHYSTGK